MSRYWLRAACLLLSAVLSSGCSGWGKPALFHPGSASVQRNRALRYDPYPEKEVGPAVDGSRPREYQTAPPEPSRARWQLGNWGQ